ncbi:F0F1 ATP synthase subunit B [Acetivibrio clariflavus]|uniref:ATP synthase subunit b n=1 Tax=Acetivibrio clariflavus (strain DSM 19732 / NBRC 101661 / EBR45) TaxID=720554 RepID=G8M1V5_ACECE|nr:F0F1 ATP synthase subunit B [Acetivibrio clariflavus]AEV67038.1 ATP synthase F0 subcomplex B subunit [Acetivibrio clariflavus DSM 19732]
MGILFNIPDFVWTMINLAVLYLILRKVLFKPVTEFMENRANSIRQQLEESKANNQKALELKENYEKIIASIQMEAEKIKKEAEREAQEKYDEIIKQAKAEAEILIAKAREEMEMERIEMMKNMRNEIVSLALEAASKVIEANMDTEANRRFVDEILDRKNIA